MRSFIYSAILSLFLVIPNVDAVANICNCGKEFLWIKNTFEKNDAGFDFVLKRKGRTAYKTHSLDIAKRADSITNVNECKELILEWLKFFRKGHFGVTTTVGEDQRSSSAILDSGLIAKQERIEIDERLFLDKVNNEHMPSPLGVWESSPYRIAIVSTEDGYAGVVLDAPGTKWGKGQVKLKLFRDGDVYKADIWMGNFSLNANRNVEFLGNNIIKIDGFAFFHRKSKNFEDSPETERYLRSIYPPSPYYEKLSDSTAYLRIPSFAMDQKRKIDSLLIRYDAEIKESSNLIIDLRNNGGGSDASYQNLLSYLYTNPIRTVGVEIFSTELNNKYFSDLASDTLFDKEQRLEFKDTYEKLNSNLGKFVRIQNEPVSVLTRDTVFSNLQQVSILINEFNASSTEQFLLAAKQSKKVKLYGRTTYGALDISNMNSARSPSGIFEIWYCISRSLRLPNMPIDDIGIQPDFYLDPTIQQKDWVSFVIDTIH
ncbi:S41 family peptidase [Sphingobacterium daejeonense]|uniref:S41 family peptidase n=1 Tax=Sphingobacterium daejeonense TaxID=371142 RepID=UPI0021A6277A|nr:S41 family peptidase [Sphingobacterium daejeonense]MCT1531968.1 S41 family peptidase [Sphingobacterium daejeonense]